MRVGLGSYAFRWAIDKAGWTPADLLTKAAALGAEVVQICDNMPLEASSASALEEVGRLGEQLGLELELGIRGARPEQWQQGLDVARRIGARLLRLVLSPSSTPQTVDEWLPPLCALLPDLQRAGVTLALENHFDLSPAELACLVRSVDDPLVGVCLDPLNSIARLIGPAETVATLAPLAVSVHVKDAIVNRAGTGFCIAGCRLGSGLIDVPGLLAALRAAGRRPNLLLESWMDPLGALRATLAQEEEWARSGVAWLRDRVSDVGYHEREAV